MTSNRTVTKGPLAVTGNNYPVSQYSSARPINNASTTTLNSNPQQPRLRNSYMVNNGNYAVTNRTVLPRVEDSNPQVDNSFNNGNLRRMKECNFHYTTEGDLMRICETCERHYYACELCRTAKEIDAPITICMKCAPSLRIIKPVLERKDLEIRDLLIKLRRHEAESSSNEELRRQLTSFKKQNEDFRAKLRRNSDEISTMKVSTEKAHTDYKMLTSEFRPKNQLTRDLKALHLSQEFTDCTITCKGAKFPAHKCILCARSEPLKRMLNPHLYPAEQTSPKGNPKDPKNAKAGGAKNQPAAAKPSQGKTQGKDGKGGKDAVSNVDLNDVPVEFMPYLMNYIYTGETEHGIDDKTVYEMMRVGKRLGLSGLVEACLDYLCNRVNKNTVVTSLITAYEYKHEVLKKKCMDYIERTNIDIVETPQWKEFKQQNPKLALDLYERYSNERANSPKMTRKLLGITSHDVSHMNTNVNSVNSSYSRTPRPPQDPLALLQAEARRSQDPPLNRSLQDPFPFRPDDPSVYRQKDPSPYRPLDPSPSRPIDPAVPRPPQDPYRPLDPSTYRPQDPSTPYRPPLDPSTPFQPRPGDSTPYRPQDPSALRPQDPAAYSGYNFNPNNLNPQRDPKMYPETPLRVNT